MGIQYTPLTPEQRSHLDSHGDRVWTELELKIMQRNVSFYDSVQKLSGLRCKLPDCGYVIGDSRTAYAIAGVGLVCDSCWAMSRAILGVNMRRGG